MRRRRILLSWLAATLCAAAASQTAIPLAWLIGAALGTAMVGLTAGTVSHPRPVQCIGLLIVGTATGAKLDAATLDAFVVLAPLALILPLVGALLAILFALPFARFSGLSTTTGFFSLLPGGVIEISHIAQKLGGDGGTVAILHAVRIGVIVVMMPLALFIFVPDQIGATAPATAGLVDEPLELASVAILLGIGLVAGFIAEALRAPVPWLLGPLIAVGLASAITGLDGPFPSVLIILAQILLGHSLGSRLRREALGRLPRALAFCLPYYMALSLVAVGLALAVGTVFSVERDTILLAFAIGGAPEMVLLAEEVGANAPLVVAFHIVRSVLTNASAGAVWRRFGRRDE